MSTLSSLTTPEFIVMIKLSATTSNEKVGIMTTQGFHFINSLVTGIGVLRPRFNIKWSPNQYKKSHCGDKTVVRSSYLHHGNSYNGKTTSLYWIRALKPNTSGERVDKVCIMLSLGSHYNDVIMGAITSQITSFTIVFSTVYLDLDQRKHQSSASLAFVRGIHRRPVNSPHKGPVTRKMFPFDDVIMSTGYLYVRQSRRSLFPSRRHSNLKIRFQTWLRQRWPSRSTGF